MQSKSVDREYARAHTERDRPGRGSKATRKAARHTCAFPLNLRLAVAIRVNLHIL